MADVECRNRTGKVLNVMHSFYYNPVQIRAKHTIGFFENPFSHLRESTTLFNSELCAVYK